MLYYAKFRGDLTPILVDAPDPETAAARVTEETDERPATLHEVPAGLLVCEIRFEGDAGIGDAVPGNPGDSSLEGIALDPFGAFAEWLIEIDDEEIPDEATAPTEPAPGSADGE
jgi:hypothetical protein